MNTGIPIALLLILSCGMLYPRLACTLVATLKRAFRRYLIKRYGRTYATEFLGEPTLLEELF